MCILVFQGIINVVGVKLVFCFVVVAATAVFKTIEIFYFIQCVSRLFLVWLKHLPNF